MKFLKRLDLLGVIEFSLNEHLDNRGSFIKYFYQPSIKQIGVDFKIEECYVSNSKKGTIRGMHFQKNPNDIQKIITCTNGSVLDVLLDLRPNSPTYLNFTSIELSKKNRNSLYIPTGIAHGFQSLEENTEMLYLTDGIQSKECEVGIKWDSFGFDWPHSLNQISERDKTLPSLNEYIETLNK
jgi:dTDP-4-dehydrorhamnose 3,5-epimerase/CDP-3, 6-dideoxy-D-glycero-D-glycero-4-hexulose-5-epimerase